MTDATMAQSVTYRPAARALHWLTVAVIVIAVIIGLRLEHAPAGWGDTLYRLHWSFGLTALFLTVVRIVNRGVAGAPPPAATLTRIELLLSGAVHKALYLLLIIAPMLGWLGKCAYGGEITVFGLFNMPAVIGPDEALAKQLLGAHKIAVKLLIGCIALHVAGALNHALIKRDGVFQRMWPRRDG